MNLRTATFVAAMALGLSCASYCGDQAFTRVVHEETAAHTYSVPAEAIWKETAAILGERGHEFSADAKPTEAPVLSDWQGSAKDRRRYSVRIIEGKVVRLEVHEIIETEFTTYADTDIPDAKPVPTGTETDRRRHRDHTVEWEVLRRLDPERASEIEQMALERRDEVEDVVSKGCT